MGARMTSYTLTLAPGRDDGVLLIDGEPASLPGPVVGVEVSHPLRQGHRTDPLLILREPARFRVTFQLPVGRADEFTLVQGCDYRHEYGDPLTPAERLEAVGRIHRSNGMFDPAADSFHCVHCRFAWPCPTRRALDGDPHAVDGNTGP